MRIVIDLDGTICPIKNTDQTYDMLVPYPDAVEKIHELRSKGHYVIIYTARNMATCQSNLGKVMRNIGKLTLDWLEKNNIEFDEIYFGKPNADIYIDDRSFRFESWQAISEEILTLKAKDR